jgi:hypothetical protein
MEAIPFSLKGLRRGSGSDYAKASREPEVCSGTILAGIGRGEVQTTAFPWDFSRAGISGDADHLVTGNSN